MIIANDATVKAGAFFPMTCKKVLRAQRIAMENRLPLVYLVDSAGVFLPLQDEVFPDEDDFGRIFRNNAVISAAGMPQFAAIMGNCVAGGGYLPVLCDKLLMTEGSGLYLAGPALVKAAIGQAVDARRTGRRGDARRRSAARSTSARGRRGVPRSGCGDLIDALPAERRTSELDRHRPVGGGVSADFTASGEYDVRDLLAAASSTTPRSTNTRPSTARRWCAATAGSAACRVGIVANQTEACKPADGPLQFGGVIYVDSADKAARFIMDCNQTPRADPVPPGRERLHGRPRLGAGGHHPRRREAGQRHHQQRRAEDHADHRRLVRRRQLRAVRQGVRPALHLRLADRAVRRHGRRPGGGHAAGGAGPGAEARRPRAGRGRTDGNCARR